MKWVADKTHRFPQRPHYEPHELDVECDKIITEFLKDRHGRVDFPVSTDDLTILIETVVTDLDMYADLSHEPGQVEGLTEFRPREKPRIRISQSLSAIPNMENRLRTTLTHEFGHVHFHGFLFEALVADGSLFETPSRTQTNKCRRSAIVGVSNPDWMEWQAGYVCGAILMPGSYLQKEVWAFTESLATAPGILQAGSAEGSALIRRVADIFIVSLDAARVRLLQRGYLTNADIVPESLFRGT